MNPKYYLIIAFFLISSCSSINNQHQHSRAISSTQDYIDIVFDLDWTLVYSEKNVSNEVSAIDIGDGYKYVLSDNALEIIKKLYRTPGVRISFYSGASKDRNIKLLENILFDPNTGENLRDIAYKVLSFDDLVEVDPRATKFAQHYKKDLSKISNNLDNIILIDDSKDFVLPDQTKNQLRLAPTYS